MTVLVSDSFNRADVTDGLGTTDSYMGGSAKTWTVTASPLGILSGQVYTTTNADKTALIDMGVSDGSVQLTHVVWQSNSTPFWRATDKLNAYLMDTNTVYKRVTGAATSMGSISPTLKSGDVIKVTVSGSTHTIYVNGVQKLTFTDTFNQTATQFGFNMYSTTARIDNFSFDDGLSGGGTGTTYSGAGISQGLSSLTTPEKVIQSASGSVQGNSSLTSAEKAILSASGTFRGNSSLSSSETVISHTGTTYSGGGTAQGSSSLSTNDKVVFGANGSSQGTTILSPGEHLILPSVGTATGQSSLTSNETVVQHGTTTYSGSGQAQGSSSLSSVETMSYAATGTAQGLSSLIAHEIIRLLASGISEGYSTVTFIDKSNQIIGTIHLKGSQSLNVNLKGGI